MAQPCHMYRFETTEVWAVTRFFPFLSQELTVKYTTLTIVKDNWVDCLHFLKGHSAGQTDQITADIKVWSLMRVLNVTSPYLGTINIRTYI